MLASSQQFCVKWNSYSSNLQNVFPRLLTSEHFVDITLACEGQMIKCHKVVLSACSTYFENLLIHNPCQHPIIFMKDMKHREVQALVDFMYKGEVNVSQEELNSLLRAAEALQIRGLCGSDHSNVGNQQNSPRQQVGENRLPAVSLPHDTVLSGRESPPFKRRRTVAEEQEQTSKVAPSQNNRASIGSSSSLMEVNNLPVAATPSSHNTFLETDSYSDHVENKLCFFINISSERRKNEENVNNNDLQECISQDEQLTGNDKVYFMNHAGNDDLEDDNEGPEKADMNAAMALQNVVCVLSPSDKGKVPISSWKDGNAAPTRIRRSEAELTKAAECVQKGMTFQNVSDIFNIPISTIRFYMARRGILPQRRRGRTAS
ncbi:Protein bric-a-brac 2, partial [Zootermopsis nevadensis]